MKKSISLQIELFRSAQNGDMQSMAILLEQHRAGLYAVALRWLGFGEVARDAVQETFIIALLNIGKVKEVAAFPAWLYRILRNYCLMYKRKERVQGYFTNLSIKQVDKLIYQDTEQNLEHVANEQKVRAALALLPESIRLATMLRYFSRFHTYETIAQIVHIPVGTVRSRLSVARAKLSKIIKSANLTSQSLSFDSEATNSLFHELWENLYESTSIRERFFNIHEKRILIIGNSGKKILGRQYVERGIHDDMKHGAKLKPSLVLTSGNITIVEGPNENSPEFPHHCPPESAIVYFHQEGRVYRMHIYDSR